MMMMMKKNSNFVKIHEKKSSNRVNAVLTQGNDVDHANSKQKL